MIVNETTLHKISNETEINNYWLPYGLQQRIKGIFMILFKCKINIYSAHVQKSMQVIAHFKPLKYNDIVVQKNDKQVKETQPHEHEPVLCLQF